MDHVALQAFQQAHRQQIDQRDGVMNRLFDDLAPWLDASAPWQPVFRRYTSARPEIGARCAGQLCTILLHVDNSPKGRAYLRARDVLMPGAQQLVWRMITMNDEAIATQIKQTLDSLTRPVPSVLDDQADGQAAQAAAELLAALGQSKEFVERAAKAQEAFATLRDASKPEHDRRTALGDLVAAGHNNIGSLIASLAVSQIKAWPATALEKRLAQAQLLSLVHGMGAKAVDHVRQSGQRMVGTPAKRSRELQGRLNKATHTAANQAGQLRLAVAGAAFDCLGLAPALRRAAVRKDGRTVAEAGKALVDTAAAIKSLRSTVYETLLYKELPEALGGKYRSGVTQVNVERLANLKKVAAYWVSAGTAIGVVMDAFDADEAGRNGDMWLARAYWSRAGVGLGTIASTLATAGFEKAPTWLLRINFCLGIATVVLTATIVKLKGEAWANWLKKQPFNTDDSNRTPYSTERALMLDLGEALAELQAQ